MNISNYVKLDKLFNKAIRLFLIVMLAELVLGGGGRFTEFGSLSVRMVIYLLAIPISALYIIIKEKISITIFYILLFYTIIMIVGIVVALINKNPKELIFEDIKPLLFFYVLPFFSVTVNSFERIALVVNIIKICSVILGLAYIAIVILLFAGIVDFTWFYEYTESFGEIFFKGEGLFFYKGFLFLCIGFFFMFPPGRFNILASILLSIAILLTLTRGFILMTVVTSIFYLLFIYKNKALSIITISLIAISAFIALPYYFETLGDKSESDQIRYITIDQVLLKVNPFNFFLGDGFGKGVQERPVHMEISYLEIFSKQGIIGLSFWVALLLFLTLKYFSFAKDREKFIYFAPFYLSVIFVYLQSLTNPFINNPIGMSIVLITVCAFQSKIVRDL